MNVVLAGLSPAGRDGDVRLIGIDDDSFILTGIRRDRICDLLEQIEGVVCVRPSGAFYVLVELPVADADDFAAWMLTSFDYLGETVSFAPGSGFYADKSRGRSKARFSFCASEPDEITRAMKALEMGLAAYNNR